MNKIFFVVIDERDKERFRRFRIGSDVSKLSSLFKTKKTLRTWALPNSIKKNLWQQISKNDIVFFALNNESVTHYGKIYSKKSDSKLSTKLWGDSLRGKLLNYFLMFENLNETSIQFGQLVKSAGLKSSTDIFPNLYLVAQKNVKQITDNYLKKVPKKTSKQKLNPVMIPVDLAGAPDTRVEKITRFIRDTAKTKLLKKKYQHRCQICNYRILISSSKFYSEVHHLFPLKDGGDDNFSNMLVLCPTHHAEFDYKVIGIDEDGQTVINKDGNIIEKLKLIKDHKIHEKNIKFHLSGLKLK
ncbi:MAG: HNH endonuclease [Nitrosopumilaceae archaeon]